MRNAIVVSLVLLAGCHRSDEPAAPVAETSAPVQVASSAAAAIVPAPAPSSAATPGAELYRALGTEPFWSVEVTPGRLRYSSPENQAGTEFAASRSNEGAATVFTGGLEGKPVTLRITPGTCSDGMSDTVYSFKAQLEIGTDTLSGCAKQL